VETKYDSLRGGWWSKEVSRLFGVGVRKCKEWVGSFLELIRFEVVGERNSKRVKQE
jgi:hypothetical protein